MTGYRELFIKSFHQIASFIPTRLLISISHQNFIAPFYHVVSDRNLPHIQHLYKIKTVDQFEQDLDFLLKQFKPIDYFELQEIVLHNKPVLRPSFLLSFDDGLREFHDVIAPVLWQKGIPAICFLNSDFIDNQSIFYRYKSSLLIDTFIKNPHFIEDENVKSWLKKHAVRSHDFRKALLSISYQNRNELDELANLVDYDFNEYLSAYQPYLTTNQINTLINKGFQFGSHSLDHPEYRFMRIKS